MTKLRARRRNNSRLDEGRCDARQHGSQKTAEETSCPGAGCARPDTIAPQGPRRGNGGSTRRDRPGRGCARASPGSETEARGTLAVDQRRERGLEQLDAAQRIRPGARDQGRRHRRARGSQVAQARIAGLVGKCLVEELDALLILADHRIVVPAEREPAHAEELAPGAAPAGVRAAAVEDREHRRSLVFGSVRRARSEQFGNRLPGAHQHGNDRAGPHAGGCAGSLRAGCAGGGPCGRGGPRQTAHRAGGRSPKRPDEDAPDLVEEANKWILAIQGCTTIDELKEIYGAAYKALSKDKSAVELISKAKDAKKGELA